jgi:hypothetical protein
MNQNHAGSPIRFKFRDILVFRFRASKKIENYGIHKNKNK